MPTIERVEPILVDLPLIRPHALAMAVMTHQSAVLVRLRCSDGSEGWGEGTTIGGMAYGAESVEAVALAVERYLAPALEGQDADRVGAAMARAGMLVRGAPIAKCAVETALWDARARRLGVPVSALFGGRVHDRLEVAWTLASGEADREAEEAERLLEERRHRAFKVKIGRRPLEEDAARVAAIKRALGERASVRVDVNEAWSRAEARRGMAMLADAGIDLVEQPLAADDPEGMAELRAGARLAIMADESLRGPRDAFRVARAGAADVLALKITQSGGLGPAAEVAAVARAAGLGLYGGTMIETEVGTAAAAGLFATLPGLDWGTELFGPRLLAERITTEPLGYGEFGLVPPDGPGIGVEVDPDRLARFRRDGPRGAVVPALRVAGTG